MKSAALDTSVVMRLLTGSPENQAQRAFDELTSRLASGARVFVSDLVISEAYFALQHHYRVPKAEALRMLEGFLSHSGVMPTGAAAAVLRTSRLATGKPGFVDRLIHAEALGNAEELLTFETAAARLKHTRVLRGSE
jgi:predicted nucleic-acid-binding protein